MIAPLPKPSEVAVIAAAAYNSPWRWQAEHVRAIDATLGPWRVIAYQGTVRDGVDILRDIRFLPWWDRRGGFGPAGFVKGVLDVIEDMIADTIEDARAGRLLIVGHSLGGSLALRTAAHFRSLGCVTPVFAFEPARCGLGKLRRTLADVPIFISVDGNDVVPEVPFLYYHPAEVTHIGRVRIDPLECHKIATVIADLRAARVARLP